MDSHFSFGPNGAFFAKSDSIWAWSDNNTLPEPLRLILEDPNHPQANKFPYDVAFPVEPGMFSMSWKTVKGEDYYEELFLADFMRTIAQNGQHCTRTVFGPNASYFTISPSGYSWQNLPPVLENDILGRIKKGHPTSVALGVHGSFVVLYSDGQRHYIALSPHAAGQYYVTYGDASLHGTSQMNGRWTSPLSANLCVPLVLPRFWPGSQGGTAAATGFAAAQGQAPLYALNAQHGATRSRPNCSMHIKINSRQNTYAPQQTSFFDTSNSSPPSFDPSARWEILTPVF
ncbi:hypothetical protein R3P38DRAFT_3322159 [Favolaschia claudopus]|uniref:Uncharacterized protein n=1 Tax=Favolaschia claudopus TaxID=2862362 RepID=A0AAW0AMK4_9AGAR